jgi:hypothetical protein
MKEILNCYANWRIDVIMLLAIVAIILTSGESETFLTKLIGFAIAIADIILAKYWRGKGRLSELDSIAE